MVNCDQGDDFETINYIMYINVIKVIFGWKLKFYFAFESKNGQFDENYIFYNFRYVGKLTTYEIGKTFGALGGQCYD
jgi:hypothetical protein